MTEHAIILNPVEFQQVNHIAPATLQENDVHLWLFSYETLLPQLNQYEKTLNAEEKQRAQHFKFSVLKQRYILARGVLRELLAKYLNIEPTAIQFSYTQYEKPHLKNSAIQFNLSHNDQYVLIGVRLKHAIGVDIESRQRNLDYMAIAKRYFSENEYQELLTTDEKARKDLFFNFWTLREAFLKMRGTGIIEGFDRIQIKLQQQQFYYEPQLPSQEKYVLFLWDILEADMLALATTSNDGLQAKCFLVEKI